MRKNLLAYIIMTFITIIGCERDNFGLDEKNDPQSLSQDQGELGDYFVNIQVQYSKLFEEYHEMNRELVRMTTMTGGRLYQNAFLPTSFDTGWRIAYTDILINAETIISLGNKNNRVNLAGAARVFKVMTYLMLTDMFGDIPYTEALLGEDNLNPKTTPSSEIYADLIKQLETAKQELSSTESVKIDSSKDLMYKGNTDNWIKAVNSLLIRMYVTQRKAVSSGTTPINEIVQSGDYIQTKGEDFEFKYSTTTSPDSRHFLYANNYITGASDYFGNFFMDLLLNDKTERDPRLRYYLVRQQTTNTTNVSEKDCLNSVRPVQYSEEDPFCELVEGYWGRDHGDDAGIPPDTRARTTWGVYPAGGEFDANQGIAVTATSGGKGAGISPYMLSSYVDFYLAEASLTMGVTGDSKSYLLAGVSKSINKVISFGVEVGASISSEFATSQNDIDAYLSEVEARYENASDNEERLAIIAKEFYLASLGNGYEAYNLYRRTSYPSMQPALDPNVGSFIRTFKYPADLVNRNINVSAKPNQTIKVFWDTEDNNFLN